jgi:hypothetical protein
MNHESQSATRWSCRLVRMFGRGAEGTHVAQCPDCQRYFRNVGQFESALRRDARVQRAPVPAGLDSRILRALSQETSAPRHRPAVFPTFALGTAGVACVAVAAWFLWGTGQRQDHFATVRSPTNAPAAVASLDALTPSVQSVVSEGSLQNEVTSVYADARSAVHFLALNFLPTTTADSSGDERSSAPTGTG